MITLLVDATVAGRHWQFHSATEWCTTTQQRLRREFVRAQLSVILEERVERETKEKIARQLCYESELNELRLQIESIRSNVKRTSCAEDRKNTSSNYRISIGRAGEHMRETSPAVLMAEATIPVTTLSKKKMEWTI
ncbi:hypothetical protein TNCV_357381 [Trichonephila clavipes]|nr:hypothetical protein TNCV_357381 [Trichonephila clavipes]